MDEHEAIEKILDIESRDDVSRVVKGLLRLAAEKLSAAHSDAKPISEEHLSAINLPVGFVSLDETTTLGKKGYLYLTEGTNVVLSRYKREESSTKELLVNWLEVIHRRFECHKDRLFVQFIVPEKISALPELFPNQLNTPTDLLKGIEDSLSGDCRYFSSLDIFRDTKDPCFSRLDSHQNTLGSYLVTRYLAQSLGCSLLNDVEFSESEIRTGDLASRLVGVPLYESQLAPNMDHPILALVPTRTELFKPAEGGHLGTRCIWKNKFAPIHAKVVIFGNSCVHIGGRPRLSWWLARLFQELHFVWSNEVDDDYVDNVGPDIVLAQTMERFLFNRMPQR